MIGAAVLLSGCEPFSSAQNTFSPGGEVAEKQKNLFLLVLWPALAIFVLVQGGVIYIMFRYRQRREGEPLPLQVHGSPRMELAWTVAPAILLAIIAVPTLGALFDTGRKPHDDALRIDVQGQRFTWNYTYPGYLADGAPLQLFGEPVSEDQPQGKPAELHIPTGREIGIYVTAADVIHSFWVPKLAGKIDVVPGRENYLWLKADKPGTYRGQCAEFCGASEDGKTGHSQMRLIVVAESPEDFEAWLESQGAEPAPDAPPAAEETAGE